jgi:1-acyl-sn-glycerol-3-phosphate acyltransferase
MSKARLDLRSLVAVPAFVFITASSCILGILSAPFSPKPWWITKIQRTWARTTLLLFGVSLDISGLENFPSGGSLVVFNHSSHLDVPALYAGVPGNLRFGAKAELFRIPVFGAGMRALGALEIHRGERGKVLKLYQTSVDRAKAGETFVLAPEGTRQDGEVLGRFKAGPFIFALAGGLNIVPVVIYGAQHIHPRTSLFPVRVQGRRAVKFRILPSVDAAQWPADSRKELQAHVRSMMDKHFQEMKLEDKG